MFRKKKKKDVENKKSGATSIEKIENAVEKMGDAVEKTEDAIKKTSLFKRIRSHRVLFYSIISVIVIIIILFSTNAYLYINFLLGNDIVVTLNSDKEDLSVIRGEEKNITVDASITTNPFCKASCEAVFEDISLGAILNKDSFNLKPGSPMQFVYKIRMDEYGEGQRLYRANLECEALSTMLCHTSGQKTYRNILITVEYKLSEEEKNLKLSLEGEISDLKKQLDENIRNVNLGVSIINSLDDKIAFPNLKNASLESKNLLKKNEDKLLSLQRMWDEENYFLLGNEMEKTDSSFEKSKIVIDSFYLDALNTEKEYYRLIGEMNKTRMTLEELKKHAIESEGIIAELNILINEFNTVAAIFNDKDALSNKKRYVETLSKNAMSLSNKTKDYEYAESIKKTITLDIEFDLLCTLELTCLKRPTISERENQTSFSLKESCDDIETLNALYSSIKSSDDSVDNATFDSDDAKAALLSLKQYIAEEKIASLNKDNTQSQIIKKILSEKNYSLNKTLPNESITPLMALELAKTRMRKCEFITLNTTINEFNINISKIDEAIIKNIDIEFGEPSLQCCVFGKCQDCCITESCMNDEKTYPVVFLHGHSFNKAVAADYSLDAFNFIQKQLEEEEGYLNAGAISIYTSPDVEKGGWGLSGAPISVKASYYFDLFQESQSYVVVQAKSENIDTYAIRLKDILKTIKYRTGKDKVIIVAHSMGGLVARRYIQIFGGGDVTKLIMIATPNHGIKGNIADYCSIVGEQLECRDLNSESLLINKVNREKIPEYVSIYNIIGAGCDMKEGDGDGVVLSEYAKLIEAKNFYVNGTCSRLNPLHTDMLNTDKYPQVYSIISNALKIE